MGSIDEALQCGQELYDIRIRTRLMIPICSSLEWGLRQRTRRRSAAGIRPGGRTAPRQHPSCWIALTFALDWFDFDLPWSMIFQLRINTWMTAPKRNETNTKIWQPVWMAKSSSEISIVLKSLSRFTWRLWIVKSVLPPKFSESLRNPSALFCGGMNFSITRMSPTHTIVTDWFLVLHSTPGMSPTHSIVTDWFLVLRWARKWLKKWSNLEFETRDKRIYRKTQSRRTHNSRACEGSSG
jgi:hypothetical protein